MTAAPAQSITVLPLMPLRLLTPTPTQRCCPPISNLVFPRRRCCQPWQEHRPRRTAFCSAISTAGFAEEAKVKAANLDPSIFPNAAALEDPAALGRLTVVGERHSLRLVAVGPSGAVLVLCMLCQSSASLRLRRRIPPTKA